MKLTCTSMSSSSFLSFGTRRVFILIFWKARVLFGLDPPAPPPLNPPSGAPSRTNREPICFFKIGIHLHTHQDLKLKYSRVMGQILRYGRPCTSGRPYHMGQKTLDPPGPPPHPPIGPMYIPIDSSQRQDSEYINLIDLTRAIQKLCLLAPPGSPHRLL